jgi:acetyl-CoA carboxylase alpha subunit
VIDEPLGGAHRDPDATAKAVEAWIAETLVRNRYDRFRRLGGLIEDAARQD